MFDRPYLKERAKARLRAGSGNAILVLFLAGLLRGSSGSLLTFQFNLQRSSDAGTLDIPQRFLLMFTGVFLIIAVASILYSILFASVVQVGVNGWCLRYSRGENPPVGEFFCGFRFYLPAVKTTFLRDLYIFLWSLITCGIMGVVKGLAYSMTGYILCENPNLPPSRALKMSEIMTNGAKLDLFVFELSYIGWAFLTMFTCGILGILYVNPYQATAHACIYDSLKDTAIRSGKLTWDDFGQLPPPIPPQSAPYPTFG